MERVEKKPEKQQFIKIGGGTLRLTGRIIKPGQRFYAYPDEIPKGFRDLVRPVDGKKEVFSEAKTKEDEVIDSTPVESVYHKQKVEPVPYKQHTGAGWYFCYDTNGNLLSENKLRKADADVLLEKSTLYDIYNDKGKKMSEQSVTSDEADNLLEQLNLDKA